MAFNDNIKDCILVANNCVGARVHQILETEFSSPFSWCLVTPADFKYVYHNLETINFKNYTIDNEKGVYFVNVDGKIKIYYPHYIKDEKYKEPFRIKGKNDLDVHISDVVTYIKERYERRVSRLDLKKKILFIVDDKTNGKLDGKFNFSKEDVEWYLDKENVLITTFRKEFAVHKNVIFKSTPDLGTHEIGKLILKK